jgi:hypothetical protein
LGFKLETQGLEIALNFTIRTFKLVIAREWVSPRFERAVLVKIGLNAALGLAIGTDELSNCNETRRLLKYGLGALRQQKPVNLRSGCLKDFVYICHLKSQLH